MATSERRVVVIDDDPSIREVAVLSLSAVAGYEAYGAGDGTEGVDLVRRVRPDAVLLDVMMPSADGPTVLARLREADGVSEVPVVFLTAKVGAADISRLDGLGAAAVITKPFDPLDLPRRLADALGWDG